MSRGVVIAINVLVYDALWTLALLGAGRSWWWCGPAAIVLSAVVQLRFSPMAGREGVLIVAGACLGVSLDILARSLGFFQYRGESSGEFAIIFFALWINFGTTLRVSFSWMWRRPVVAALFGVLGAPAAYWIGARLGAITLVEPTWRALAWASVQFGVVLPVWMLACDRFLSARAATGLQPSEPATTRAGGRPAS